LWSCCTDRSLASESTVSSRGSGYSSRSRQSWIYFDGHGEYAGIGDRFHDVKQSDNWKDWHHLTTLQRNPKKGRLAIDHVEND